MAGPEEDQTLSVTSISTEPLPTNRTRINSDRASVEALLRIRDAIDTQLNQLVAETSEPGTIFDTKLQGLVVHYLEGALNDNQ